MKLSPRLRPLQAAVLALFLLAGTGRAEDATAIGKLAAALKPGEWVELMSEGYERKTLMRDDDILAYTGRAAWDGVSGKVLLIGQQHLKGPPTFISYSVADNTWRRMPTPKWAETLKWFHAYENNASDSARGHFYHHSSDSRLIHKYVVAKGEWSTLPELEAPTGHGTALEYFPEMASLVRVHHGEVWALGDSKDRWTKLASKLEMGPYHNFAAYSPKAKAVFFGGGNDSRAVHILRADGKLTVGRPSPVDLGIGRSLNVVDPATGSLVVLAKGGRMVSYDSAKDEWRELPTRGMPFPKYGGHSVSAAPIGSHGVVLFFSSMPEGMKCYLYKHPTAAE